MMGPGMDQMAPIIDQGIPPVAPPVAPPEPEMGISGAAQTPEPEVITKNDIEGWKGGMKIDLSRVMKGGKSLRDELSLHLGDTLGVELKNHEERVSKLRQWDKQYRGKREPKSFPHQYAANTAPPMTRSDTDVIVVRIHDSIFNRRKYFILKPVDSTYVEKASQMEDALDWYGRNIIRLQDKLVSPLLECVKYGLGMVKIVYESKKRTVYRYASNTELLDDTIQKYSLKGTDAQAVKVVETVYEGPNVYPIPAEDFIISTGATSVPEAYLAGFRFYLRKEEIKRRAAQGLYDADAADKVANDSKVDENKEERAKNSGLELKKTEYAGLHPLWELWFKYDVDEDGEEDDIVVVFNYENGEILSAIYNPIFTGFRPFFPLRFYPIENSFWGEGACEVLETLQKELDDTHNQRFDLLTLAIAPPIYAKPDVGFEQGQYVAVGTVKIIDGEALDQAYKYGEVPNIPPASTAEEDRIIAYGERALGISPANMGISTSERPVAKDTLALLEENNKKFLFSTRITRSDFANIGRGLLDVMAQYMPHVVYKTGPLSQEKSIDIDPAILRDGIMVELEASNETMSQEVRREVRLTEYTMMMDYAEKMAPMLQAFTSPETPSDMKLAILEWGRASQEMLKRVIKDFDERDPEKLIFSPFGVMDVKKCVATSADLLAMQQQAMAGAGGPPGSPGQGQPPAEPGASPAPPAPTSEQPPMEQAGAM